MTARETAAAETASTHNDSQVTSPESGRRLFGFDPWQLAAVAAASLVSTGAAIPADPLVGVVGLAVALVVWASLVELCRLANGLLVARFGGRLPGLSTTRLYAVAAIVGLAIVTVQLASQSPSAWTMLSGRFTPEIAVYGVFGIGALVATILVVGKGLYVRVAGRPDRD